MRRTSKSVMHNKCCYIDWIKNMGIHGHINPIYHNIYNNHIMDILDPYISNPDIIDHIVWSVHLEFMDIVITVTTFMHLPKPEWVIIIPKMNTPCDGNMEYSVNY